MYSLVFLASVSNAQSQEDSSGYLFPMLIAVAGALGVWALLTLADNLMQIEAKKVGLDTRKDNYGVFPSLQSMFKKKAPEFVGDASYHNLTKGADIKLAGKAEKTVISADVTRYALQPNLYGLMSPIPKVLLEVGSEVKAGEPLFYDKKRPEIQYVSPVSGEVVDVIRGPKRAIHKIVVLADKDIKFQQHNPPSLDAERSEIVNFLLQSGGWSLLNQRPFDIVPDISAIPRDIFISTFDSAPLAPDLDFVVEGRGKDFQKGVDVLGTLTDGSVFLGLNANGGKKPSSVFMNTEGAEKHWFAGKHPAGNVGIQIHNIKPIRAGETVWTVNVNDVLTIGKLFNEGIYDGSKFVALTGNELSQPGYVKTYNGANISELLAGNIKGDNLRIVAGDVLSGRQVEENGFLGHNEDQITTLTEGDNYELFGWLLPIKPRPSLSGTFPNFLFPNHEFEANTNTHGEKRAFVVSGQYEAVLPMDIYPQHLMKAILANDFERMEGLGIYELSEEDIALCEFSCTSKMPLQKILRDGLNTMQEQL